MVKVTILDRDPNLKPEMSAKATFLEKAAPATADAAPYEEHHTSHQQNRSHR